MKNIIIIFFTIIPLVLLISCSKNCAHKKVLGISISSGGGFTGIWEGYEITNDSQVYKLTGPEKEPGKEELVKISEEDFKEVINVIRENRLYKLEYSNPGNMSRKILIRKSNSEYFWVWDVSDNSEKASKLNNVYNFINTLIEKKKTK